MAKQLIKVNGIYLYPDELSDEQRNDIGAAVANMRASKLIGAPIQYAPLLTALESCGWDKQIGVNRNWPDAIIGDKVDDFMDEW